MYIANVHRRIPTEVLVVVFRYSFLLCICNADYPVVVMPHTGEALCVITLSVSTTTAFYGGVTVNVMVNVVARIGAYR